MGTTFTMTDYGLYPTSGASLKTLVDTIPSLTGAGNVSGAGMFFIPVANGQQIKVIRLNAA
jgi:hypothetical protein